MKFGRKPAVHTLRTARSMTAIHAKLAALGPPPAASNAYYSAVESAVGADWQMLGNDNAGDCVEAQQGHVLMLRSANAGAIIVPTTEEILALYSAETGYVIGDDSTDNGTDETSDAQWMLMAGILGHKADATAMLDPTNTAHLQWSVQLFGSVELGVNWTQQAMDEFNAGGVITDFAGDSLGGHSVPIVHYDAGGPWIVTWGKRVRTTWAWVTGASDEAHALVFGDWIAAQGTAPSGLNLSDLVAELQSIKE